MMITPNVKWIGVTTQILAAVVAESVRLEREGIESASVETWKTCLMLVRFSLSQNFTEQNFNADEGTISAKSLHQAIRLDTF